MISVKQRIKNILKMVVGSLGVLRAAYIFFSLALQLLIFLGATWLLDQNVVFFNGLCSVLGLVVSLRIVNARSNPAYKIPWIILILFLPVFGLMIYLLLGNNYLTPHMRKELKEAEDKVRKTLNADEFLTKKIKTTDPDLATQMHYLRKTGGFPVYKGTVGVYLSPGEKKFEWMKAELRRAKYFIFLEYFIIAEGSMWDEVLEILLERASRGVEIRVMYDDFGSLLRLPSQFGAKLDEYGIRYCAFGDMTPVLRSLMNHRDHRKILVIDGQVGFTGGINIGDEYINKISRHGHWKDASIMLKGEAVWSLTVFFLSIWDYVNGEDEDFLSYQSREPNLPLISDGYFQPYADSPLDQEQISENVYLNMIGRAKHNLFIQTPYLVIDHEMMVALCNAAKQGVDVRIVTPAVWDHWYVHAMTRSNYEQLTESGVRVYEYTPGFIHSKIFICDREMATIGTPNVDYRSLYLHFECGTAIYLSSVIGMMEEDFMSTLDACHEYSYEECRETPWHRKLGRGLLKVFAPLM